jgi:glycine reductase complex component B subunit alpha and beta
MPRQTFELHTLDVHGVRQATETGWRDGLLEVDLDGIAAVADCDPAIAEVAVELVRPGDPVRLVNVVDVVEPAGKPDAGPGFPGILGDVRQAGVGRTVRLGGAAVVALADLDREHATEVRAYSLDGDAVIDMDGPCARCCHWSGTHNVVVNFAPRPDATLADIDRGIRHGTLAVADALASSAGDATPDNVEHLDLSDPVGDLPTVCMILQVGSEGALLDTFLYGRPLEGIVPTLLDPAELLDGALVNGAMDWAGVRNPTYFYQRNDVALGLARAHRVHLNFAGIVLALAYLSSETDKARSALQAANLAAHLGSSGAVICGFASGNSQTDLMLTIRACERAGIRTVGLVSETDGGLTDHVGEADCLVSAGNEEELMPSWEPRRAIGGAMRSGLDPRRPGPVPLVSYFGSTSQLGNTRFKAVWN